MPKTILLADDSVTIRKVVELTFSDTEIRVEAVGSGREALERIQAIEPDLVLADVAMPEPSGYEICEQIKGSGRPVPVLLLAGTFEPFDTDRARACGADGHVVKPFESAALIEKVEALLSAPPGAPAAPEPEIVPDDLPGEGTDDSEGNDLEAALESLTEPDGDAPAPATEAARVSGEAAEVEPDAPFSAERAGPTAPTAKLSAEEIDAVARAVVERLSSEVLREIAWEVVPELAETIIRERIRELEREVES